jgi:hypothetical protein
VAIKPSKPGAGFAWRFHYGLRTLKRAYDSSRTVADKEKANIEKKAAEHQKLVDTGKSSWVEHDEDGYPGFDYGEHLGELLNDEETVLNLVKLAFVISLHHYFEQQLGDRLPKKKYNQEKAFAWLRAYGWQPAEAELNELRLAANCAKHSAGKSAGELYALRPDMFDDSKIKMGFDPGYDSLALSDTHVEAFFDALKKSVPNNLGIAF